jgi:hypothetical protein
MQEGGTRQIALKLIRIIKMEKGRVLTMISRTRILDKDKINLRNNLRPMVRVTKMKSFIQLIKRRFQLTP